MICNDIYIYIVYNIYNRTYIIQCNIAYIIYDVHMCIYIYIVIRLYIYTVLYYTKPLHRLKAENYSRFQSAKFEICWQPPKRAPHVPHDCASPFGQVWCESWPLHVYMYIYVIHTQYILYIYTDRYYVYNTHYTIYFCLVK